MNFKNFNFKDAPVTYSLIGLIIFYYLYTVIRFGFEMDALEAYNGGAFMPLMFAAFGQYWRLITSNLIHFGIVHLLVNSMSLFNIGPAIELIFGRVRYMVLIFVSGICTNLLPYLFFYYIMPNNMDYFYSCCGGASGIILGLVGGLCFLALYYKGIFKYYFKGFIPSLAMVLIMSVAIPSVSLSGHLGGFIGGFLTTMVMVKAYPYRKWKLISKDPYLNQDSNEDSYLN